LDKRDYTAPAITTAFIFVIIVASSVIPGFNYNDAFTAVATLLAAFVGAKAAFHMQDEKKMKEDLDTQCSTAND